MSARKANAAPAPGRAGAQGRAKPAAGKDGKAVGGKTAGGKAAGGRGADAAARARRPGGFVSRWVLRGLGRVLGLVGRGVAAHPVATLAVAGGLAAGAAIYVNVVLMQPGPHPAPLFATRPDATEMVAVANAGGVNGTLVRDIEQALVDRGYLAGPAGDVLDAGTVEAIRAFEAAQGLEVTGRPSETLLALLTVAPNKRPAGDAIAAAMSAADGTAGGAGKTAAEKNAAGKSVVGQNAAGKNAAGKGDAGKGSASAGAAGNGSTGKGPAAKTTVVRTDASAAAADPGVAMTPAEAKRVQDVKRVQKALADLGYGPLQIDGRLGGRTATAIRRFRADHALPAGDGIDARLVQTLVSIGGMAKS